MALKSLYGEVRSQFIYFFTYLFFYLFLQLFCFNFKTLPEPYKPLQDTKHSMPRLIFTHHIFILFRRAFNFSIFFFYLGMILSTLHSFVTMKATAMKLRGCILCASASFTFSNVTSKIKIIVFGSS